MDGQKELHFSVPSVPIKRNGDNQAREYILKMTSDPRKERGIPSE